jgi:Transglycosylase SLT domain
MEIGQFGGLGGVEQAIKRAASATGVDFDFLMRTARRESGFDAGAHASTSSAAGLFQFVEQTWLSTLKRHGSAHGYARYADLIAEGADGRFYVPQGVDARKVVMDLRYDPHAAAVMAGELASDHAAYLRGRMGREPTGGELYAAHFLGPQGSARLIEAYNSNPNVIAASLLPEAAASNHGVFFHAGRALTVAEVYANLSRTGGDVAVQVASANDPGEGAFTAYAGAAHQERMREEEMLLNFILDDHSASSPLSSMFSSEMLGLLSDARDQGRR